MAKFIGGEEHEERGAGREAGYDEGILKVLETNTNIGTYEIGGAHVMGEGPDLMGSNVQIVAGPRIQAASTLGDDGSTAAAIALGIPLAAAAGYGLVKAGEYVFSGPSKPWLYKLNPSYWLKTDREKGYIRTEHNAGYQNEQDAIDLAAAERAYKATEGVRQKESRLSEIDQGLKGGSKAPPAAAPTAVAQSSMPTTPEVSGENMSTPGENPGLDKLILRIFQKNKIPVSSNATFSVDQMAKAGQIVGRVVGDPDAAHSWLNGFMERQGINFNAPTAGSPNIVHGKRTITPDAPSDVSMKTSSSGYASPWEKGLSDPTVMTTIDPTAMPTTGARRRSNVRGWGSSPWEKGLGYSTVAQTTMSTIDPTTGARRPRSRVRGWGSSPWEKGLVDPTFMSTVDTTVDPTTGARRKTNVRGWGSSPWEKGLVDPTLMSTVDTTLDPTTGARRKSNVRGWGSSPWEKGLGYSTVAQTTMSTIDPTTGARRPRSRVRGWGSSPWEKGLVDPTTMTTIDTTVDPTTGARRKTNVRGAFIGGAPQTSGPAIWSVLMSAQLPSDSMKQLAADLNAGSATPSAASVPAISIIASKLGVAPAIAYQAFNCKPGQAVLTQLGKDYQVGLTMGNMARPPSASTKSYLNKVAANVAWFSNIAKPATTSGGVFVGGKKKHHHRKTGSVVGQVATTDPQQQAGLAALNKVMQSHATKIAAVAQAKGVGGKPAWNAADVDNVTVNVLTGMKAENGGKAPSKSDALLARNAVRFWALQTGHTISGAHLMGTFVGGQGAFVGLSLGNVLKDVGIAVTAPIWAPAYGAYWVGKKTVQGVKAVGHKIFGGGGGGNPDSQRRAALAQAAQRQAAAAQRILAAEQKQDAALQAQQQAQDLADAQSNADAAEAAAAAAEDVAAQTQATQNMSADQAAALADLGINAVSGDGSRIQKLPHGGSWAIVGYLPPAMVGKAALVAASNTAAGKRLRIGADVARSARVNPVVRARVSTIMGAAKSGNKKARHQAQTIKAGAYADAQRKNAVKTNASVRHVQAVLAWKKLLKKSLAVGGPSTGRFSQWKPFPAVQIGADTPAKPIAVPMGAKGYPKIKGVPADVIVAISAASNTFGIPPAVSASVVQAAQAGDKRAQKDLKDAAKVYKAAQKGDPAAQRQMKAVAADMKAGYAPAAQKAAVLAAAVGTTKGMDNYKRRQANALTNAQYARTLVIPSNPPYEIPMPQSYFEVISFGGLPEIAKRDFSPISFGTGV